MFSPSRGNTLPVIIDGPQLDPEGRPVPAEQ